MSFSTEVDRFSWYSSYTISYIQSAKEPKYWCKWC